jgi:hypothetical protein
LRADGLDKLEEMTTQIRSWGELEDDFIWCLSFAPFFFWLAQFAKAQQTYVSKLLFAFYKSWVNPVSKKENENYTVTYGAWLSCYRLSAAETASYLGYFRLLLLWRAELKEWNTALLCASLLLLERSEKSGWYTSW